MHSRRARPTIRVISEDLNDGWNKPFARRAVEERDYRALHPMSELPHPLILKATECIGSVESEDSDEGQVRSSTTYHLREIKVQQWRGGVWRDPATGVHWLIVAGLAKGDHKDADDFYAKVGRADDSGTIAAWLPAAEDTLLLKQETAARLLTEWEIGLQKQTFDALTAVQGSGRHSFDVRHPIKVDDTFARIDLELNAVREPDYEADEILVSVVTETPQRGTNLEWRMVLRILISLSPPEQGWDRHRDDYSNIAAPGEFAERMTELAELVDRAELGESIAGTHAHYAHNIHLAGSTVEGTGVRALCGVFFVPRQDHSTLPSCPSCSREYERLPAS
ncbi:DUF3039 domain-containing protein [Microbacterium sp. SD291]|uniref:DUF3039 domain-containing protein n=1 Tax=Microbacterium sp. SD291 TaxID=2782007 RepID=UPI001A96106C|nr:DUF3039 domain-containing protein [Microbacterium sp. SD291]MBO0980186.1 DUF3039 domain-containing protein [Microbacterium sp. SD291]